MPMAATARRLSAKRIPPQILVAGLALAAVAAVYARSLDNYFQSDDFDWLYAYGLKAAEIGTMRAVLAFPDPTAVDPADPFTWNYRPITALLVNVLFRLFGVGIPAGYHAVLLIGHLAASALAGVIAGRLTGRAWIGVAVVAVFGPHFAHVETVAWFGSIAEVTAAVLGLAAVLAFLRFRDSGRNRWAWGAVVMYGLALGANPTAAPVIGIFALLDLWRFARGDGRHWATYWPYIPLAALAGVYLAIEAAALGVASGSGGYGYNLGVHALLNMAWYPVVLIAPFTEPELFDAHRAVLAVLDGTGSLGNIADAPRFGPVLAAHLAVIGTFVFVIVRGPDWARVTIGSTLLLEAPFVLLGGTMFHFAYLPAAFGLTLGVAALANLMQEISDRVRLAHARFAVAGLLFAVAALLAWQTHGRLDDWEFAAGLSHGLVQSAHASLGDPADSALIVVTGLPNTVNGAYVFREGFQAALRVTYGRPDLNVQVFSQPVFERLMLETLTDVKRYFLAYDSSSLALKLVERD